MKILIFDKQNINISIMRKVFLTVCLICISIFLQNLSFEETAVFAKKKSKEEIAKEKYMKEIQASQPDKDIDYQVIFDNLQDVNVEFMHDEDPDEYYDTQKIHFSPYPLIRLTQNLYVRNQVITPGFYLLTPREYNNQRCVLFKQAGKIKHIVPIFEYKKVIPEFEYEKPPKKWWQIRDRYTFQTQYYERKVRAFDVYAEFYEIDLYYRDGLSKMLFKKNPY